MVNILCFNSIKVRLELVANKLPAGAAEFQFHKGTIRTGSGSPFSSVLSTSFNSIKVRLEQYISLSRVVYLSFQFHKGTIRTTLRQAISLVLACFNSIKVRLERSAKNIKSLVVPVSIP